MTVAVVAGCSSNTFSVDEQSLTRIELSSQGQSAVLTKHEQQWWVNGTTYADQDAVWDAVDAMKNLQIQSLLASHVEFPQSFVSVRLRSKWCSLSSYHIAYIDSIGWVARLAGKAQIYLVEVAGNEDADLFLLLPTDTLLWENKNIFTIHPADISQVSIQNFEQPARSYTLQIDSLRASITSGECKNDTPVWASVQRYLSYFYGVRYLHYALQSNDSNDCSLLQKTAFAITIESRAGTKCSIVVRHKLNPRGSDELGRATFIDLNYCYVQRAPSPHQMLARWIDLDILVPPCNYFMQSVDNQSIK
ncbi:hypothetical protein AGMMS4956_00390 [Bacteroidia bacterium]|nr:hypothetical protein AGMMS4956_00390 [Bacteroidia bacterium]